MPDLPLINFTAALGTPVLAVSITKVAILRLLEGRPMTVSELSRSLKIDKAAVFRHMNSMEKTGLIEEHRSARKWVYYSLTPRGRTILGQEDFPLE